MGTAVTRGMAEVIRPVAAALQGRGFRKSARHFNRPAQDGLIHVITFQMGRYEFRTQQVPGFASDLYGSFTVELGVVTPCEQLVAPWMRESSPRVCGVIHCSIRMRLGNLGPERQDLWWQIREPFGAVSRDVLARLETHGIPFLDQFPDYQQIIEHEGREQGLPGMTPARSALIVALAWHERGDRANARAAFARALSRGADNMGFDTYLSEIQTRLGY